MQLFSVSPCSGSITCVESNGRYSSGWPLLVLITLSVAYLVGVFIVQRGLTGRTLGSMLFAFTVVGVDGLPLGISRATLRSVAGAVDYLPCCVPIVGIVTITATPSHQRVGDLAAGSIVVDSRGLAPTPSASASAGATSSEAAMRPIAPGEQLPQRPPTATPGAPPQPPGPLWDPSRQAYVLWDESNGGWLQFDEPTQQWVRISGI
jgi:uncharacterized RDD family membrane protein YckC